MDKTAMFRFGYGLYVLTAQENGVDNGCIINTAMQVTDTPLRIMAAVNKQNKTHDMIVNTGVFTISMIAENAEFALFERFGFQSGHKVNKFAETADCVRGSNGIYHMTKGTNAYVSGKVVSMQALGTHTLFIAEVTEAEVLSAVPTVTYAYYQEKIKPKPEIASVGKTAWVCRVCGFVYEGESLPADFTCPLCKHGAADFEKVVQV